MGVRRECVCEITVCGLREMGDHRCVVSCVYGPARGGDVVRELSLELEL